MPLPAVLIVDDEPIVRLNIAATFEEAGCRAIEAASADEALEILRTTPLLEAVFTDVQMPGEMDGLALAHYIRGRWPDKTIIISSGNFPAFCELPEDARFLAKPILQEMLAHVAREICSRE